MVGWLSLPALLLDLAVKIEDIQNEPPIDDEHDGGSNRGVNRDAAQAAQRHWDRDGDAGLHGRKVKLLLQPVWM